jgi:hypothetical protein
MVKYIKSIAKLTNRAEKYDASIRKVVSYDSLEDYLNKRAQSKWKRGDVVELINDPDKGAGIITGQIIERKGRTFYQVSFWWSQQQLDKSLEHIKQQGLSEEELNKWITSQPAQTRYIPEEQLKDSLQKVHSKLVELFSKDTYTSFKPLSIRHANEQTESIVRQIKNNPELQSAIDSHCKHSGGTKSIHSLIYFLRNLLDKDVSFTDDELIEYLKDRKNYFSDGTIQESNFSDVGRVGTDANEEYDDEIADFMKYDGAKQ